MFTLLKKLPEKEKKFTLATGFTLLRIVLVPIIIYLMHMQLWHTASILFFVAAATDVIDGAVARYLNEQTMLGACLDPIADKLLLIPSFFMLALSDTALHVPLWFVFVVLAKEVIILGGVALLYAVKGTVAIAPTILGKSSTVAQIILIGIFFIHFLLNWVSSFFYYASLIITLVLVCLSCIQYVCIGLNQWFNRNYF